jgi:aldehyde:ferredoxin oxidoreductase
LTICIFPGWSRDDLAKMVKAAAGFDVSTFELLKVGERALTLARVYNVREGFSAEDDKLCERSYGPTDAGALEEGGIDRDELRQAMQLYYGMAGWDADGVPTLGKLHELDVAWAAAYLPG